jgi:hypothetical protein
MPVARYRRSREAQHYGPELETARIIEALYILFDEATQTRLREMANAGK